MQFWYINTNECQVGREHNHGRFEVRIFFNFLFYFFFIFFKNNLNSYLPVIQIKVAQPVAVYVDLMCVLKAKHVHSLVCHVTFIHVGKPHSRSARHGIHHSWQMQNEIFSIHSAQSPKTVVNFMSAVQLSYKKINIFHILRYWYHRLLTVQSFPLNYPEN